MPGKLTKVPIPESKPTYHKISWWMENTLVRVVKHVYNSISENIRELVSFSLTDWLDEIEGGLLDIMGPYLDYMLTIPDLPPFLRSAIVKARSGRHAAALALLIPLLPGLLDMVTGAIQMVFGRQIQYGLNFVNPSVIESPDVALQFYRRGEISFPQYQKICRKQGINYTRSEDLDISTRYHGDMGDLITSFHRNELSASEIRIILKGRGYSGQAQQAWFEARKLIPTPGDLVRIATREGFDEAVAKQFGYDDNYPAEAGEWAKKGGLDPVWFKRLWRAHWELPGVNQGYEMFQREIINERELRLLLRARDIPSFWRDALIKLSYRVITRVDVRRMYDLNILEPGDVYKRYRQIGYNIADATAMTQWTIAMYTEKERDLTKADILRFTREGVLTDEEADTFLEALGYKESARLLMIARESLKREEIHEKEIIKNVKALFLTGVYDAAKVIGELGKLNPPAGFIKNNLELWTLEKRRRVVKPSVTDIKKMFLAEVILETDVDRELGNRGYSDLYISWYKRLWLGE